MNTLFTVLPPDDALASLRAATPVVRETEIVALGDGLDRVIAQSVRSDQVRAELGPIRDVLMGTG